MRATLRSLIRLTLLGVVLALAACATELASPAPATATPGREAQLQPSPTARPTLPSPTQPAPATATPSATAQLQPRVTASITLTPRETRAPATATPGREARRQTREAQRLLHLTSTPRPSAPPLPRQISVPASLSCGPTPTPTSTIGPSPTLAPPTMPGTTATATAIRICNDDCGYPGKTIVKWFVGLGTGTNLEQVEYEQLVVDAYNEQNEDNIYIALNIIPNAEAYNILATQIAAGTPPDIIGPVGLRGITFANGDPRPAGEEGNLLPLDDLIARCHVDLSAYDERTLAPYRDEQGRLLALPYALFPSFIYFNKDLFDAAGLAYPPQKFGEQYEGQEWNMDALRELAMKLTLDENGVAADEEGFNPHTIVQFGFVPQWNDSAINDGAFFGAGDLTGPNNEATIPQSWKEAWRWFYQARHVDHFMPDAAYTQSEEFGQGNVWKTGKVAMAWTHLWYTCCFETADVPRWDLAVVPSYNGTTTAKLHADTFAIMKQTKDPEAAFKVYMFLLENEGLRQLYGGLSPITAEQPAYFAALDQKYAPNTVRWQVALDSLAYPDIPNHEQAVPNYLKFQDRYVAFDQLRHQEPRLDIEAEIERFEQDLTAIFQGQ